jgi:hypothetical protein
MGSSCGLLTCGCVWPNRDPEDGDEPPVEGDDNLPFG